MADPDQELDLDLIKRKTVSGVVTFTLRSFFIQAFTFFATFILTILLAPSVFGVFFVVSAILNLFVYFSDIGLAAALIQKKEKPTEEDFKTTFTIQQAMILSLVLIGLLFSKKIAGFYHLDDSGLWLLRVLIFSLSLSSLKTIPSIILERRLDFTKLIIPQIVEHIIFYSLAIILAYKGLGLASFTYSVLARGIVGLILIYIISPWKPGFSFSRKSAKNLVSFGLPFQANSVLALLKDDLLTVFLGKILPYAQVGYVGWAQKFAFVPLRFFMDNVIKVTFPAYSRLQENKNELGKAIDKSIFFVTFFVYPSVLGMMAIAKPFVDLIPKYNKWEPALPLLYFFGINALFAAVNTTLSNTLFAIGKPKIVLNLMVFWTILTWLSTYLLVIRFGYLGVGMASALVAGSTSVIIYFVKKNVPIQLIKNVSGPLLISILMFIVLIEFLKLLPVTFLSLALAILLGIILYSGLSLLIFRENLIKESRTVVAAFLGRKF
ncbi:MAG: hypothetical protein COU81_01095 [Candidatus Portnoybacteria bacterium CG10_big_fil_rev_8_21_14_0_10_36_7]|uniref:Uncharacterized protein n=1 Tax=Candidatus Portnoybacteria bacterium CG10_big_fil_rev_8_21_14_0_10_36_7 TaxID=1974812 RepID=A0A2M8KEM0_9BACT|nr:MAG: hypothetical protein COU81_01095 [Candidatus Portnoybacteria bacterium CG10_big_fil_rev_8_21_14_0_10_36_7]